MHPLSYVVAYIPGLAALAALAFGGAWVWAVPAFIFVFVPTVELFMSGTTDNLDADAEAARKKSLLFDSIVWGIVPLQLGALGLLMWQVSRGTFEGWELAGAIFSTGLLCGAYGLNVGHELGHRPTKAGKLGGLVLMGSSLYPHFLLEHNRGHHRRVATPEDPASARRGDVLYPFWIRSIVGGFKSAWGLDKAHVARVWAVTLALLALVALTLGPAAAGAWIGAGLVGILLLETVNYVEHYGLSRKKLANGKYERTQPCHSWNANHPLGRILLFDLTRHSDHHAYPGRRYQVLRYFDGSPQLPTGYPGMILLALVPPLYFAVMHPHLDAEAARLEGLSPA